MVQSGIYQITPSFSVRHPCGIGGNVMSRSLFRDTDPRIIECFEPAGLWNVSRVVRVQNKATE